MIMKNKDNIRFIQSNEACVEGAIYAGIEFFAGYPITPSTEILEHLAARLPQKRGKFIQMEDEIASMGAIIALTASNHEDDFFLMMKQVDILHCLSLL